METQAVNGLGQDVFLKLLVTELKFQDPLQPLESTAFITQLAEFSALEQMSAVKGAVGNVATSVASLNNISVAGLIGKEVQVAGSSVPHVEGRPEALNYALSGGAKSATIRIINATGDVVRTISLGPQAAGMNVSVWDGLDNNGNPLPAGDYAFSVEAKDPSGLPMRGTTYTFGRVDGVSYTAGVPYLMVNGSPVPAAGVSEVRNPL